MATVLANLPKGVCIGKEDNTDYPCLTEYNRDGMIQIICKSDGGKPIAEYICLSTPRIRAWVHVHVGYYVIQADKRYGRLNMQIYKITEIKENFAYVHTDCINRIDEEGNWVVPIPDDLRPALMSALCAVDGLSEEEPYWCSYP